MSIVLRRGGSVSSALSVLARPTAVFQQPREQQQQSRKMASKCVNLDNLNPCIKVMEYAVRGPLVIRATEIEKELEQVCKIDFFPSISENGYCRGDK